MVYPAHGHTGKRHSTGEFTCAELRDHENSQFTFFSKTHIEFVKPTCNSKSFFIVLFAVESFEAMFACALLSTSQ